MLLDPTPQVTEVLVAARLDDFPPIVGEALAQIRCVRLWIEGGGAQIVVAEPPGLRWRWYRGGCMGKLRKRTKRCDHYQTMAAGYQILKSPLADSYSAAAEHYRESDPPLDAPEGSVIVAARKLEPESERG